MKHRILATLSLAMLLLPAAILRAQDTTKLLGLAEAIDLSIKNSKQLKSNKAEIDEATAHLKEIKENRLPDVSFSGTYMYLPVTPTLNLKLNTGGGSDTGTATSSPKVRQALYGMASASLPIYAGGRFKYGIESGGFLQKAAMLDADNNRQDVIMNTTDAFANLYKAKAAVALVKESLEQSRQRVTDFTNLEKNGLLARNDLLKSELLASNNELTLLDAESNYKLACVNMDIMLGLPQQTLLAPDSSSLKAAASIKNIDEYEQLAFTNRKDIEALMYRRKAAETGIKSAKSEYYPTVGLSAGYLAADVPKLLTAYNVVNIGVGIKYSLSSLWKTDSKVQQAKARSQEVQANEEMMHDNVIMQVNRTYQQYLLAQKKIEVYQKAVDQAAENYRITKNKYDNSLATTTDLLDADVAQFQARLNYTFAKTDAAVAYTKLLQVTGTLEVVK